MTTIKICKGNSFRLHIPLDELTGYDSEGKQITVPVELSSLADTNLNIVSSVGKRTKYEFTATENTIIIHIAGNINEGVYGIEFTAKKSDEDMRYYRREAFRIVNSSEDADLPTSVEFGIDTYTLTSAVVFAVGKNFTYDDLTDTQKAEIVQPAIDALNKTINDVVINADTSTGILSITI
jgi:hypothetical protein